MVRRIYVEKKEALIKKGYYNTNEEQAGAFYQNVTLTPKSIEDGIEDVVTESKVVEGTCLEGYGIRNVTGCNNKVGLFFFDCGIDEGKRVGADVSALLRVRNLHYFKA